MTTCDGFSRDLGSQNLLFCCVTHSLCIALEWYSHRELFVDQNLTGKLEFWFWTSSLNESLDSLIQCSLILTWLSLTMSCRVEKSVMLGWLCKVWKQLEFSVWRERKKPAKTETAACQWRSSNGEKKLDSSAPCLQKLRMKTIA